MKLTKKNKELIVGLDEAGRGPLAGPVVAVAVRIKNADYWNFISNFRLKYPGFKITDSKKISSKKREKIYQILSVHPMIEWGMGIVSEKKIDKINILEATKIAMEKAIKKINCKNPFLIIDGNFEINVNCKQKSIIKGDEKVLQCSIASIIAKVKRDKIMEKYHEKYPRYCFNVNKGYGTKNHINMIKKYGLCPIHRKSFKIKR